MNSSIAVVTNNASLTVDSYYEIDMSSDVMLIMVPIINQWNTKFTFTYTVDGE